MEHNPECCKCEGTAYGITTSDAFPEFYALNWSFADDLKRDSIAQRWPVRTALWLFVAILLIGGWAAVIRQVQHERADAEQAAILQAQNRATALEQYVTRTLEAADLVTLHLGYKYFIHRDLPAAAARGSKPLHIVDPVVNRDLFAGGHARKSQRRSGRYNPRSGSADQCR